MKMRPYVFISAMAGILAVGALALAMQKRDDNRSASVEKMNRLCMGVKLAMQDDARAFESGDPKKQEAALDRFYEGDSIYHSAQGILYCIDEKALPHMPVECQLNKDWKCLADIAKKIEGML